MFDSARTDVTDVDPMASSKERQGMHGLFYYISEIGRIHNLQDLEPKWRRVHL